MKKLFAILMSVLMIACFMPTAAFADETKAAKIGTTEYETLDAAIEAVTDKTPTTIELLSDVTLTGDGCCVEGKNIIIKGNGKTIKLGHTAFNHRANHGSNTAEGLVEGSLTIKKVNFEATTTGEGYVACLGFNSQFAITLEDCTFTNMYTGVYANPRSKALVESEKLESITITNCTYSDTTWGYSIDNVTPDSLLYSQQATVIFKNNTGLDKDHEMELFSEQVAEVDGTRYKDFGAALNAADGKTLKLLADIEVKDTIKVSENTTLTLDTNGKTITNGEESYAINNLGTMTINGGGKIIRNNAKNSAIRTLGSLTLENVTVEVNPENRIAVKVDENGEGKKGTLVVNEGTVLTAKDGQAIQAWGDVTINGGKMNGSVTAWSVSTWNPGNITVKGGEINDDIVAYQRWHSEHGYPTKAAEISVEAGTVIGELQLRYVKYEDEKTTEMDDSGFNIKGVINVTGGTFKADPSTYVKDLEEKSYIVKRNGSEGSYTYTVLEKSGLKSGVYLTDPKGYLASSRYYISDSNGGKGPWTVSYASSSSSASTTTTDNVTNKTEDKGADTSTSTGATTVATTTATVKTETKTAADGTKTVAATVDTTTASKIVEKAVENKSEEVVVDTASAAAVTETAEGTKTEVALPAETITQVAEKTEAAVTIKSDAAEVKLDKEAVKAVAEAAGTAGEVKLEVKTVAQNETKVEVDLKLVTSKGTVSDFKGGSVSVTVKLNTALAAKPVVCVYIDDHGTYHKVKGVKNADGTFTFETGHFSTYAVIAKNDANEVIAEQTANVEKLAGDLTLKARSEKTEKGNIKVTLTVDDEAIKAIEDLGYTVKYKFYRSTKKAASYKAALEKTGKTYTNTAGKKGTKYYYKARVMVYDAQGKLIAKSALTQCKYACRKF